MADEKPLNVPGRSLTAVLPRLHRVLGVLGYVLIFGSAFLFSRIVMQKFGLQAYLVVFVALFAAAIYAWLSLRRIEIPFLVWLLTIGGFRSLLFIRMPVLPDVSTDRLAMIWLAMIFVIKMVAERKALRGPFRLDILVGLHLLYTIWRIWAHQMEHFHTWTMYFLIPYAAFYLAKNIIVNRRYIELTLVALLLLSVYYDVTSVAEKFNLTWLVWPKYILDRSIGREFAGRSRGPFTQAALFGTVIGMLLTLYPYFMQKVRRGLPLLVMYGLFGLGLAGLFFTYTRGSWLAGFLALGTCIVLGARHYVRYVAPFAAMLVVAGGAGLLGLGQDEFAKQRMENSQTVESRMASIITEMRVWADHPLFGVGLFNYTEHKLDYLRTEEVPLFGTVSKEIQVGSVIHDIYIGPLAEDGLVGMGLQWAIWISIFLAFKRQYALRKRGDPFASLVLPVLAGICVGYHVGGAVIDYRYFSFVSALYYTAAGIVDGHRFEDEAERDRLLPDAAT